jgi:hypothetical protein
MTFLGHQRQREAGPPGEAASAVEARHLSVYRAWRAHRPEDAARRNAVAGRLEGRGLLQAAFPLVVTLPLDVPVFVHDAPWIAVLAWVPRIPAAWVGCLFAGLWAVNGALAVRLLARFQGPAASWPARGGRFLLGGVPLLGFLWLPSLGRLGRGGEPAADRRRGGRAGRRLALEPRLRRWVDGTWWPSMWHFPFNTLAVLMLGVWLGPPAERRALALALSLVLHVTAAAAAWRWVSEWPDSSRTAAVLRRAAALLLLLPVPLSLLALLPLLLEDVRRDGSETLVWKAAARGAVLTGMPIWSGPMQQFGRRWSRTPWWRRPLEPGGTTEAVPLERPVHRLHLFSFCRLRVLVAFFEGYLLAIATAIWIEHAPAIALPASVMLSFVLLSLLAIGVCWYLALGLGRLAAVLRLRPRRVPRAQAWFLLVAAASVLAGFVLGRADAGESSPELGMVWLLGWFCVGILAVLRLMTASLSEPSAPLDRAPGRDPALLWTAFFFVGATLVALGHIAGFEAAAAVRGGLVSLAIAAPFAGALLGSTSLGWLLYPLPVRALRGPLPLPTALLAWSVAITAVMPLGALFSPLWLSAVPRFRRAADGFRVRS